MNQPRVLEQQNVIDELVFEITEKVFLSHPQLEATYGEKGRAQTVTDLQKHFHHLQTAYRLQAPSLYVDHVKWLNNVISSRGVDSGFLQTGLVVMKVALNGRLPAEKERFYRGCLSEAIVWLQKNSL
ncbi:hypothetical protein [Bacillus sp. AK031]